MRTLSAGLRATLMAALLWAAPALAALPTTSLIDGALLSSGGSAAADGDYDVAFAIYEANSGGTATWTETAKVKVTGGRFSHALGSATPLDLAKVAALKEQWLGMKVASDPELPRQRLHGSLMALVATEAGKVSCAGCIGSDHLANGGVAAAKVGFNYAGSATKGGAAADVECSGCVNVSDLKFDGDVDLAGNSFKAKNGTFSGTVAAAEFVGDGSKLTGLKTPAGECKVAGEVVKGINADGSLKCVASLDPAALPKDGLNEISNNLLSNQFDDVIVGQSGIKIPDNTGSEANATLDFPDIGTTQDFEIYVEVSNTDLSTLSLTVLPPDDKKTGWVLCDPCGEKDKKDYKVTFNSQNKPKSGDLLKWIGANPKGLWNLKALDTAFCIVQAPGNAGICDPANKVDGTIVKWHVKIKTLSNKKVNLAGDLYVGGKAWGKENGHGTAGGTLWVGAGLGLGPSAVTCDSNNAGTMRYQGGVVELCTPDGWMPITFAHPFLGSKVVTAADGRMINEMFGNSAMQWKLCHRWSEGKSAGAFHNNCNNKGPTVVVAKLNTGARVGGYASCPWTANYNEYTRHCQGSFLFNLDNGHKYVKKNFYHGHQNTFSHGYSIYNHTNYGPCFGGGHDFCFNSNDMATGYCNLGHDYDCRKVVDGDNGWSGYGTTACRNDICGSYNWSTVEMEVWYQANYK